MSNRLLSNSNKIQSLFILTVFYSFSCKGFSKKNVSLIIQLQPSFTINTNINYYYMWSRIIVIIIVMNKNRTNWSVFRKLLFLCSIFHMIKQFQFSIFDHFCSIIHFGFLYYYTESLMISAIYFSLLYISYWILYFYIFIILFWNDVKIS
jgi:hypothetical protein